MKTNELIAILRDEDDPNVLDYIQEAADTLQLQKVRIMELETELKKAKAERRWIPVTERLPEGDNQVLAIVSGCWKNITFDHSYELANWNSEEGWIMDAWPEFENPDVSHWMPLPEPPKEV